MRLILTLLLSCLITGSSVSQSLQWKHKFNGPSFDGDRAQTVLIDNTGNVVMAGYVRNNCTGEDWETVKYNSAGQKLWSATYNGFNNKSDDEDRVVAIAHDNQDNIYVTGYADTAYTAYIATVKYSPTGVKLWSVIYKASSGEPTSIDVDDSGNVYVAGFREIGFNKDMFLIKYNTNGIQQWMATHGPGFDDVATDVQADNNGGVYITGYGSFIQSNGYDWGTLRYTSGGQQVWVNYYNSVLGNLADRAAALTVDANGDVIVTGSTRHFNSGSDDIITIKYSAAGGQAWTCPWTRTGIVSDDNAVDIVNDPSGNLYVLGTGYGSGSYTDHELIKITAAGAIDWVAITDTLMKNNYGWALTIDNSGQNIYIASDFNFGPDQYADRDMMVQQYNAAGGEIKRTTFNGSGNGFDIPFGIGLSSTGEVAIAGVAARDDYDTDLCVVKLNAQLDTAWSAYQNGQAFVDDIGKDFYVDAAGNSYACGSYFNFYHRQDVTVIKVNAAGQRIWTYLWRGYSTESNETALALAVDANGNTYVTGTVDSTANQSDKNIFVLKLDNNGQLLWRTIYSGTANGHDVPVDIRIGSNGNIYVAGNCINTASGSDGLGLCYDPAGNSVWSAVYTSSGQSDAFMAMELDGQDNLYASGAHFPASGALSDGLVVKFSPAGTILWDSTYNNATATSPRDFFNCIAVDGNNNVFVGGQSNNNWVTAKYSPAGSRVWTQNYSYSTNPDSVCAITVDNANNVIVGGIFGQFSGQDVGIIKYRNDSTQVWVKRFNNSAGSDDQLMQIIADDTNNIYTAGWETANFTTNFQMQVLKYDSLGNFKFEIIWTDSLGNAPDYGKRIGLDTNGNLYLMGDASDHCFGTTFFNGFRYDILVAKYGYGSTTGLTGIIPQNAEAISLFPNPVNDILNIRFHPQYFEAQAVNYFLFDITGKLVTSGLNTSGEIMQLEVKSFTPGLYFFSAHQGQQRYTSRVVIQ